MTHITKTLHIHLPILILLFYISTTQANEFLIVNRCQETIWAAATPGGGKELPTDATWTINVAPGTTAARIWGRTGCTQTGPNGLKCQTGDCGGLFQCTAYGSPPNTLAEYTLNGYQNQDFIDISLVQGYNVPMRFMANSNSCNKVITCSGRVKGECPSQLRVPNGCNDACTALNRPEYCCPDGVPCNPTQFSRYFKDKCPQAYSYPKDDQTSIFTCPPGTNYKVVFCPRL